VRVDFLLSTSCPGSYWYGAQAEADPDKYAEISKILQIHRMRNNDNVMLPSTIRAGAYDFLA
jgi:hypothetical protein